MPTDVKVALIDRLTDAGFPAIEATSFVSPKWVPQMADAADVMARIRAQAGVSLPGADAEHARASRPRSRRGADEVAVFVAASETFSRKNINCGIAESLERCAADLRRGEGRRRARARLRFLRARLSVRGRRRSAAGGRRRAGAARAWAPTRSRWATRSASARAGRTRRCSRPASGRACRSRRSPAISTTRTGRRSPTCTRRWRWAWPPSTARSRGSAAVPTRRARPATSPARMSLYLMDGLGIDTGVDLTKLRVAGQMISDFLGRAPVSRVARALAARSPLQGTDA